MKPRIEYSEVASAGVAATLVLENYVRKGGFDPALPSAQSIGAYAISECSPRGESAPLMDEQKLTERLLNHRLKLV